MRSLFDRRAFLRLTGSAAVAPLALQGRVLAQGAAKPPENFRQLGAPVVQGATDAAATIAWSVNDTSTGCVEYGLTPELGHVAMTARDGLHQLDSVVHKIRLEGLTPATRYFYRTVSVPIAFMGPYDIRRGRPFAGKTYQFETLDSGAGAATSFSVINDTHEVPETLTALFRRMSDQPTALFFWNGDVFNDVVSERQIAQQLLYPADSAYATGTPVFFVRGNHDGRGAEARKLGRFIDTPTGQYCYSFREGPVAFIVLDTGEDKADDDPEYAGLADFDAYRSVERDWLAQEITKSHIREAPFRVVVAHIPLYSSRGSTGHGGDDARTKWHDLLAEAKVDLIIAGHTHRHGYLEPDRSRPFPQLTGGGPGPDVATLIQGHATDAELRLTVQKLDGTSAGEYALRRRAC